VELPEVDDKRADKEWREDVKDGREGEEGEGGEGEEGVGGVAININGIDDGQAERG